MDFYPHSDITIGSFRWSGVNDVTIRRSLFSLHDTAVIRLPGKCQVQKGRMELNGTTGAGLEVKALPGEPMQSNTGNLFEQGDKVTIKLGWNGDIQEEFAGFVRTVGRGMPVAVECEGYVYQLRTQVSVSGTIPLIPIKDLLEIATGKRDIKGKLLKQPLTDIKVVCQVDITFANLTLTSVTGVEICDHIKKLTDNNVVIFFIRPDVLWCGLPFTAYASGTDPFENGTVGYRPGWNCIRDKELKQRVVDNPVVVEYGGKYATTTKIFTNSKLKHYKTKVKAMLNNIPTVHGLQTMANESEHRRNYSGYEGRITGFLQPYCLPGYKAHIINKMYPELDGDYMVESTEVKFGVTGARRLVTVGASLGFGKI